MTTQADLEIEKKRVVDAGMHNKFELHMLSKDIAMKQQVITEKEDQCIEIQASATVAHVLFPLHRPLLD